MFKFKQNPRNLMRLFYASFALMLIIFVSSYFVIEFRQRQNDSGEIIVNYAGRQRMLSQRISLLTMLINTNPDALDVDMTRNELNELLAEWQSIQDALLNGNADLNISAISHTLLRNDLAALTPMMTEMSQIVQCLAGNGEAISCDLESDLIDRLVVQQDQYLSQMDTLVFDIGVVYSNEHRSTQRSILFIVTIVGFVAVGLLIQRPTIQSLTELVDELQQARSELEMNQLLLDDAAKLASIGAWQVPLDTMMPQWSDETRRIHETAIGYKPDLETAINFYAPEARPIVEKTVNHAMETGEGWDFELPLITAKNNRKWVRSIGGVEFVDGKPMRLYGVFQDLTEQHALNEELRRSESFQRTLLQQLPDAAVIVFDTDMRYMIADGSFLSNIGYSQELLLGKSITEALKPEHLERLKPQYQAVLAGESLLYERHDNEAKLHYEVNMTPLIGFNEEIIGGMTIIRDISEAHHAQQKLLESAKEFQRLATNTPLGVFRAKVNTDIIFINPYCANLLGVSIEELYEQGWISHIHPDDQARIADHRKETLSKGLPFDMEYRLINSSNQIVWIHSRSIALLDEHQQPYEFIGTLVDITAQRQTEAALIDAKDAAESANRSKSMFLANMSHELRTPLNAIIGFTQLMKFDTNLTPSQSDQIQIISSSGEHLLELINDILEMSRIEADQVSLNLQTINLHQLLDNVYNMMQLRAESKGISFLSEYSENTPVYVQIDARKLRQIIINLLGNAIKFTSSGGVSMRVREDNQHLYFEIEDSGAGIEAEAIPKLFEMFSQSESGRSAAEGTGLGLPISKRFVELMGGAIAVQSEVDTGTVVRFNLLYNSVDEDAQFIDTEQQIIGLKNPEKTFRILVVDDRDESRLLLQSLLEPIGFEIHTATTGLEAVAEATAWHPDLILMDIRMPEMDGFEATASIRAATLPAQPTIIAVTASAFEHQRQEILDNGCDDFISKPFRVDVLFEKIQAYLKIDYVYDGNTANEETATRSEILATLPQLASDLRAKLLDAVRALDSDTVDELLTDIQKSDSDLANEINVLVDDFRFDVIRRNLEELE